MPLLPSFEDFAREYEAGRNQVVYALLAADLDTPVSLMYKLAAARDFSFLLESVTGGEIRGRYSIVGMKPDLIWECRGNRARINRNARFSRNGFEPETCESLVSLRRLLEESKIELPDGLPAISAGIFGYLGYDMVRLVENLPNCNPDELDVPDSMFIRPSVIAVLDGVRSEVNVVSPAWTNSGLSARDAYARAAERVMDAVQDLERAPGDIRRNLGEPDELKEPEAVFDKAAYMDVVRKAKEYIQEGEIFQVVPSQRWSLEFDLPPFSFYRALRRTNPSPFMFFLNFGEFQIAGSSPEILVRVFGNEVTIRPLAGTRPRGDDPEADRALEAELLTDEKERAEHLMLLDLGRNDVGRVAKTGTVRPTEEFVIERYSHVMHIVSNVVGELSEDHDALSALLAGLPAGTVAGAPKVRAMEVIDELERVKRCVYGGGVGYFSANGDMDMCIALRTAVLKDQRLYIQAGCGVVQDSDPETEWYEAVNKSMALRRAAADARIFASGG
ncbi:MAG: anthranilate synthase component I [Albidovulum sp.]|nr:anthranilate synthase component I [Albidovulum sp.]